MRRKTYGRPGSILLLMFCTAALFAGNLFAQPPPEPVIGKIEIWIEHPPGSDKNWEEIARSFIFLEEGDRFSDKGFSQSIQALQDSKLFKSIDVPDPDWSHPPITLVFRLVPFARIENIKIHGGFPLLESEMRNVMTITSGDPYVPATFPDQVNSLEKLFRNEGFIHPKATIDSERIPGSGNFSITVNIDTGNFYRVEKLTLKGNDSISGIRIKPRLTTWQSSFLYGGPSRLVDNDVKKDAEKIVDYYRKKQFADAAVSQKVERFPENRKADVVFTITEGPRYEVRLLGNKEFWDHTLKKDMVIYKEGNQNDFGLRKSVRNIEDRYRSAGYLDANVQTEDARVEKGGKPVRIIRMIIHEGSRSIVRAVTIEGNRFFTAEKIKKQMLTAPPSLFSDGPFIPATLDDDLRAIKNLYLQSGFPYTAIESRTDRQPPDPENPGIVKVNIRLKIEEGPQTIVTGSAVKGKVPLSGEAVRETIGVAPGTPYRAYQIDENKTRLAAGISEKGYPHATVDPQVRISDDRKQADIVYKVDSGPYVEMGQTIFIGNFLTRREILDREMELSPGEPFSLKEMLTSQSNIRDISAFESAQYQTFGLEEKAGRVSMLAQVREKKPYYAQFTTGYDTYRNFYVDSAVGSINLLGLNNELRAEVQWSEIGYLTQLGITDPRFLGTRIVANGILYTERLEELNQDFGIRTTGAAAGFTREFRKYLTPTLTVRYENREEFRTDNIPIPPEDESLYDPRSVVVTTPGFIYNNVDSYVRPTRGINSQFTVDISQGLSNSFDDFLKYRLDTRYYVTPFNSVTLAFRGLYGYIDPLTRQSTIPEDQLFFLGGTADVRGFAENELRIDAAGDPVGGKTAILGSAEIRLDVGMNIELVTFYDTGTIRRPLENEGSDSFRSSVGGGIRYITAIGPVGVVYGHKLNRRPEESAGAFHLNIGYSF